MSELDLGDIVFQWQANGNEFCYKFIQSYKYNVAFPKIPYNELRQIPIGVSNVHSLLLAWDIIT